MGKTGWNQLPESIIIPFYRANAGWRFCWIFETIHISGGFPSVMTVVNYSAIRARLADFSAYPEWWHAAFDCDSVRCCG